MSEVENILSKLVSFPTISRTSNEKLINYVSDYLSNYGVTYKRIKGDGEQYNFYFRIGPNENGGLILSGHTDVVPVEGQKWKHDPFKMKKINNKFYGRGTCDMKGFLATF